MCWWPRTIRPAGALRDSSSSASATAWARLPTGRPPCEKQVLGTTTSWSSTWGFPDWTGRRS